MDPKDHALFREEQRFNQLWLWTIILIPVAIAWYAALEQLVFKRPFGNDPASDSGILISLFLFGILLPVFMASLRLITEVRGNILYVRFYPLHTSYRSFSYDTVLSCKAQTYRPIRDYGGWGIRYGSNGKAYTVSGNRGVMLQFRDGRKLLIGSQKAEELAAAMSCSCLPDRGVGPY